MEVRRTVPVKLDVDSADADLLRETIQQFLDAANYVVDVAQDGEWVETRKSTLHEETYSVIRDRTDLHSNHVQSARDRAVDALKSVVAKWKQGEYASLPTFTSRFCEYNQRNATFYDDHATLSTVGGRVTVGYDFPDENRDTPHSQYLLNDDYETTGATLHEREGEFYLHIRTTADVDAPDRPENGTVLGVDLGVGNIAVTSTGVFWSADELNHWHREYEKRRGSLAQCGTRWAHENIQSVGRTETGWFEQMLHRVANGIVTKAVETGCSYIAFERLTNIRKRLPHAKWHHLWPFQRLTGYVKYKAEARGITVQVVNPQYTSQRCSTCGFTHEDNRPSRESLRCQDCGYENHADYNAVARTCSSGGQPDAGRLATAKNIGLKLLRNQTEAEGGAPVGVRLNSGMLNTNGVVPVPDSVRVGVHAECHGL
ncbi:RNA-guided endonuclease InsQ/TnpB family protein [Halogeometricum luteum]|uniref:Transposase n=1 Tax=Halogeometricum luteum TaxID=2950537 RepID=A0ABU2G7Z6_9EURY|nr:transposase [Halogeometricum sp. S3BR5-2]MDS0296926.1 transposase [Halogeometricum sp. S3BR5-2]